MNKIITLVLMSFFLSGCGLPWFVTPKENPIIEDKIGVYGKDLTYRTMSTTAERRIVLVNSVEGSDMFGIFCAEPSPDTADNIASSISAYLRGSANRGDIGGSVDSGFDKALATTVQQLGVRSQGVQYLRDTSYSICQAYLNKIITKAQYHAFYVALIENSRKLIETEIKYKDSVISPTPQQVKTPEELLEAQRSEELKRLQGKVSNQEQKDKFQSDLLTKRLARKLALDESLLVAEKKKNEIDEEKKRHELSVLEKEVQILTKKLELLEKQKECEENEQCSNN